jgi:hypothetical protein
MILADGDSVCTNRLLTVKMEKSQLLKCKVILQSTKCSLMKGQLGVVRCCGSAGVKGTNLVSPSSCTVSLRLCIFACSVTRRRTLDITYQESEVMRLHKMSVRTILPFHYDFPEARFVRYVRCDY